MKCSSCLYSKITGQFSQPGAWCYMYFLKPTLCKYYKEHTLKKSIQQANAGDNQPAGVSGETKS